MSNFFSAYGGDPYAYDHQQQPHGRSASLPPASSDPTVLDFLLNDSHNNNNGYHDHYPPAPPPHPHERSVSASFLYAQEQDDPHLLQQHMIAQTIAWEQIQKEQQQQQQQAAHGIPVTTTMASCNNNRSMAPMTDPASRYSHPSSSLSGGGGGATMAALPGLKPPPPSSLVAVVEDDRNNNNNIHQNKPPPSTAALKPPPPSAEPEPILQSKSEPQPQDEQQPADWAVAERRVQQGQCPSCGQQLYKLVKVPRWKQFLAKRLSSHKMPNNNSAGAGVVAVPESARPDHVEHVNNNNEDKDSSSHHSHSDGSNHNTANNNHNMPVSTGANPAGLHVRKKPLTIAGVVHRGQCVKCSAAPVTDDDNDNGEEEEENSENLFLRDDYEFEEDEYLQNSILSPLVTTTTTTNNATSSASSSGSTVALANYQGPVNEFGERHGPGGTLTWSNGDVYKGSFVHGQRHGAGTLTFGTASGNNNKGEYVGDWFHGEMHGQGTRRWTNGDLYTGPYAHNQRCGSNGRFYFANGDLYVGEWKDDQMHGLGRYYYHHGQRFEGDFVQGQRHGKGKLQRLDGSVDVFWYTHNVRSATGVRWSADRTTAWKLTSGSNNGKHMRKQQIPVAEAVSLAYEMEHEGGRLEPLTTAPHTSDLPDVQGTTV